MKQDVCSGLGPTEHNRTPRAVGSTQACRFSLALVQLLRGEVGGVETLYAILVRDLTPISHLEVRSFVHLSLREEYGLGREDRALA